MGIITKIDGIPLYSTREEASNWAIANGLSGYHVHVYRTKVGYMGGVDHSTAVSLPEMNQSTSERQIPEAQETQQQNIIIQPARTQTEFQPRETVVNNNVPRTQTDIIEPEPVPVPQRAARPTRAPRTTTSTGGGGGGY